MLLPLFPAAKENVCGAFFPPPMGRGSIGKILEDEGFTTGIELGVQRGQFAKETLENWPSAKTYHLVDAWQHIDNYVVSPFTQYMTIVQDSLCWMDPVSKHFLMHQC